MDYRKRQNRLIKSLGSKSLDAFLIRKKHNIFYLTGIKGDDSILFISGMGNFLITDARYKEEYSMSIKSCRLVVEKNRDIYAGIEKICKRTSSKRIGFESKSFSYSEYTDLKKRLKNKKLIAVKELVECFRMIKDQDEVKYIKEACTKGCDVMNFAQRDIRPFLSENAIRNRIEFYFSKKAIKKADFDIIVASGKNASMPHATSSTKKIKNGEMVVIDLGAMNCGYNSDLTRTLFLGRISHKYLRIYNIVLGAQKRAVEYIKPGIEAKSIDNISRSYISKKGLGKYFIHSLGHGIGLEPHEKPYISRNDKTKLEKNMTVTIEPGVYIPRWGGVRIEDVVLVTKDGCEILTSGCRDSLCK